MARKLERITDKLRATVMAQTQDPEDMLDTLIAAWEEMHREAKENREMLDRHGLVAVRGADGLRLFYEGTTHQVRPRP